MGWRFRIRPEQSAVWFARVGGRRLPAALIALSRLALVWSHLIGLSQGLWYDELNTLTLFANHGPSGVWSDSQYIPGDHMLFILLTLGNCPADGSAQ
jgi:hypothetical protein